MRLEAERRAKRQPIKPYSLEESNPKGFVCMALLVVASLPFCFQSHLYVRYMFSYAITGAFMFNNNL